MEEFYAEVNNMFSESLSGFVSGDTTKTVPISNHKSFIITEGVPNSGNNAWRLYAG